jgi:Wiskott-Aldrich syndrome protein
MINVLLQMGFTENAYPSLPAKIKAQLPPSGIIEKDKEDDIVTTLLEELLSVSPKLPAASGSGVRKDRDIPGAWH